MPHGSSTSKSPAGGEPMPPVSDTPPVGELGAGSTSRLPFGGYHIVGVREPYVRQVWDTHSHRVLVCRHVNGLRIRAYCPRIMCNITCGSSENLRMRAPGTVRASQLFEK